VAQSGQSFPAGNLIGFSVYERIGIGIVNLAVIPCPQGCIRVWDEVMLEEDLDQKGRMDDRELRV